MKNFQQKNWNDKPKVMHKATCSECGRPCQVPFLPVNGKPVYCADCFDGKRDQTDTRSSGGNFGKRDFNDRGDRFAPRSDSRPSFRSDARPAFTKPAPANNDKQLSEINMKLDRLIGAIEKMSFSAAVSKVETPEKASKKATVEKVSKPTTPKAAKKAESKKKVVAKKKK